MNIFTFYVFTSQTTENVNQNLSQKWNAHIDVYVQHVCILENVFKTIFSPYNHMIFDVIVITNYSKIFSLGAL